MNEIFSAKTITVLLGVIGSIIASAFIDYVIMAVDTGDWTDGIVLDTLSRLIGPMILLFIYRIIMKESDKTVKEKDRQLLALRKTVDDKKAQLNTKDLEIQQMKGAIEAKKQEIEMLSKFVDSDIGSKLGY